MDNKDFQELKIDEIVGKIHDEVLARKDKKDVSAPRKEERPKSYESPLPKAELSVRDLLNYHDDEFVRYGYRMILKREPDAKGFNYFLTALRSAQMSKCEVLGRLRYSPEGKAANVSIRGLWPRFVLNSSYRIPLLGYVIQLAALLARLPKVVKNLREHEAFTDARFTQQTSLLNKTSGEISARISEVNGSLSASVKAHVRDAAELRAAIAVKADAQAVRELETEVVRRNTDQAMRMDVMKDALKTEIDGKAEKGDVNRVLEKLSHKADIGEVDDVRHELSYKAGIMDIKEVRDEIAVKADVAHVQEIKAGIEKEIITHNDHITAIKNELHNRASVRDVSEVREQIEKMLKQINESRLNIISQQKNLAALLDESAEKAHSIIGKAAEHGITQTDDDHILDALYVSFEEMFRGAREVIKERQKFYLKFITGVSAGGKNTDILDLGSGRGEWIELLKENGYRARGIDLNRVMVQQCRDRGLDAVEDDVLHYLQAQKDESIGVITGFHIVEHLPLRTLVAVLDESFRVLRRGGMVIFETPNPENIIVGSCTFYLDPSHNRPIPPDTLKFIVESRGFGSTEIHKLNPLNYVPETRDEVLKHIAYRFNMSQDFSLVAVKQ